MIIYHCQTMLDVRGVKMIFESQKIVFEEESGSGLTVP